MPGRNDSQRNKMDKNEATYSLAKTDISHDIEAEDNKDCVARLKQEADGATPQKLKLQWHSEEETDSTNEKSKKKHLILPDDWGGQVKLPLSVSKSGSQDNAKVESHNTSRTDMEGKLVQSIKCGRFRAEVGKIYITYIGHKNVLCNMREYATSLRSCQMHNGCKISI